MGLKRRHSNDRRRRVVAEFGGELADTRPDPAANPEQEVGAIERRCRLLEAVEALPERDRRCLYLRAEGLRYRQIAEVLGVSLGGVALSLKRSLASLTRADRV